MARDTTDTTPIAGRDDLVGWLEAGCKPGQAVGIENEKLPFYRDTLGPVPYEGDPATGRGGIRALLDGLAERQGWERILEDGRPIGLADDAGTGGAVSLEPGGQFELSRRAAPDAPRVAGRARRPPRRAEGRGGAARHRLPGARREPEVVARRGAGDAQGRYRIMPTTCRRSARAAST